MKLELLREKSRNFPHIEDPLAFSEIRIWHCSYQSLSKISDFQNVESIEIATYPDSSLDIIGKLPKVKSLKIIHLPRVKEITPLSKLECLEILYLAVLPSWNKLQHIATLKPLQNLANLRSIDLHGIIVDDFSLSPLHSCPMLEEFKSGNLFSMEELLNLKNAKPNIKGNLFVPLVEIPYVHCTKCGTIKVMLSGVAKNAIKCPKCNKRSVQKHLDEWKTYQTKIGSR
jgi:phage FluMu protein Com